MLKSEHIKVDDGEVEVGHSVLLRPNEVAAALCISPKTLANWRVAGGGPKFVKLGSRVAYAVSDLDQFIRANKFGSTTEFDARDDK
ncbi:helix-turn-helix transcriptional regulator [Mesorhizobium sp. ES1-4]|uniref:helix-turn-helix transcriptional regulator n=1 Tax=Mesorhizobium sp. ES1-4 TaxID=2876627 RepID=UPI001CCD0A7D|nr:helix-turn-helix domain-containing protein [Mesorhizobium sp. ES1-4]MBZ9795598.1 helix-turn-helix domain-containing protein [Mesorhizobium sp. ES1-4]